MGTDPRRLLHTIVRKLSANRKHEQDEHGEAKQKGFKNRLRYKPARRKTVQNALAVVKCDPCFFFLFFITGMSIIAIRRLNLFTMSDPLMGYRSTIT